jgi:hypothetical protein
VGAGLFTQTQQYRANTKPSGGWETGPASAYLSGRQVPSVQEGDRIPRSRLLHFAHAVCQIRQPVYKIARWALPPFRIRPLAASPLRRTAQCFEGETLRCSAAVS